MHIPHLEPIVYLAVAMIIVPICFLAMLTQKSKPPISPYIEFVGTLLATLILSVVFYTVVIGILWLMNFN